MLRSYLEKFIFKDVYGRNNHFKNLSFDLYFMGVVSHSINKSPLSSTSSLKKKIIIIHAEYKNASLVVINTCHSLGTMEHLIATRPRTCPGNYSNRPRRGTVRDHRKTPINPVRITPQQCALAVCVPCIVRQVYCLFHS